MIGPSRRRALKRATLAEAKRRARVRQLTTQAFLRGELEREPCERCGSARRVELHHETYEGRNAHLMVRFLCRNCHLLWHHGRWGSFLTFLAS
jgi:hypothetical protein